MAGEVHVGIDLAWSTGTTGLAAVDDTGRLLTSTSVQDDDETVPDPQFLMLLAHREPEHAADQEHTDHRGKKHRLATIIKPEREQQRRQHGCAGHH